MLDLIYSPSALRKQMREHHRFLILEEEGEPIGYASWSRAGSPGVWHLHKLYVLTDRQGKGLGKALLDYITADILPEGARALHLNVNRHNKARQFYERMGFSVIGEEDKDIGNNYFMNDYVMELPLAAGGAPGGPSR
jgi:GNAT superfamily N-acetyltransferase